MHPVFPPEVFSIILSKLDDDLTTLLNCRLVCYFWNAECLKILRRSKFRKTLTPSDLQNAAKFGSHEGRFILPLQLEQELYLDEEEFEDQYLVEFETMSEDIVRLIEICGPDCIRDYCLDYDRCTAKGLDALNKFLGLICAHLQTFKLFFVSSESLSRRETVQILRMAPVLFPNLREFKCQTELAAAVQEDDDGDNTEGIESVLIENSHNLETLSLASNDGGYVYWPKQTPTALRTLKSLYVEQLRYPVQFPQNDREKRLEPILETFECRTWTEFGRTDEEIIAMEDTLQFFSKTLKSVRVELGPSSQGNTLAFPFRFPACFPRLEHLRLTFKYLQCPAIVYLQDFNINPTTFPVLHSMEIPFGCVLVSRTSIPPPPQSPFLPSIKFPTVRTLGFLMNKFTFQQDTDLGGNKLIIWEGHDCRRGVCQPSQHELQIPPQKYVHLIAQLFPSLRRFTVTNSGKALAEDKEVVNVIKAIFQSGLPFIERFEVEGQGADYLRNALK